jgi:hypothetical protein
MKTTLSTKKRRSSKPTITKLKKLLWEECKRITRKRYGNTCYTCGTHVDVPHTGHFIPSSICSTEMRYDLDNLRLQCFRCNIHLSGNWVAYEAHLIVEKGRKFPDLLKKRNEATKGGMFREEWYLQKIDEYKLL